MFSASSLRKMRILIELLDRWLEIAANDGRWISTGTLYKELQEEAQPYRGEARLPLRL